jgi:hypothetical protein
MILPQDYSAAGRIRAIEKCSDLIGNRNLNLQACSIVPQVTTLPRAPSSGSGNNNNNNNNNMA